MVALAIQAPNRQIHVYYIIKMAMTIRGVVGIAGDPIQPNGTPMRAIARKPTG